MTEQDESILNTIKKLLGIAPDYKNFDTDIIININTVFMTLHQLGVGPKEGFHIESDREVWDDYISDDDNLDAVRTYVYLKVKLLFDPPLSATVMESFRQQIQEYEWRLNVQSEEV